MKIHSLFNDKSDLYEKARPVYPDEIYRYLVSISPSNLKAWDCACGNGQVSEGLSHCFEGVIATDVSEQQIANAKQFDNVIYRVMPSESTDFPDDSFDLVCVAQALHWFDFPVFWPEVKRVLKPDGVFAAWGYTWPVLPDEIERIFHDQILNVIAPYWATQNSLLTGHYKDVEFPFERLSSPKFEMKVEWNLDQFFDFIKTFSATRRCTEEHGEAFLDAAYEQIETHWSADEKPRVIPLEFVFYAGRNTE
ncbi:class I SAM-dependent methyltransferase [Grimontia marina]|uniref:Putative methyltransferase YcgJ n=1 Tax=Grimontia marina TaxID=646534 RepID=A0A128FHK5_9GAMM|nr:class I SAM-dependent methyltransferase [Grimontia marina]CZF86278.1 putative methyltransferase YcgJ [Grimontia marina]